MTYASANASFCGTPDTNARERSQQNIDQSPGRTRLRLLRPRTRSHQDCCLFPFSINFYIVFNVYMLSVTISRNRVKLTIIVVAYDADRKLSRSIFFIVPFSPPRHIWFDRHRRCLAPHRAKQLIATFREMICLNEVVAYALALHSLADRTSEKRREQRVIERNG